MPAPALLQIKGSVVSVRARQDGTYGILVGPGPDVYWYLAPQPLELATRVEVTGQIVSKSEMNRGASTGTITVLDGVSVRAARPPYARRIIAKEWRERVQAQMRRPLYRYQSDGAGWIAQQLALGKGAILADDPGLGKSAQTVAALCATRMFPAIVVCPMSVKINWAREFAFAAHAPSVEIINGSRGPLHGADVVILNHDLLLAREDQLRTLHARVMVLDEAQAFKEPKARPRHRAAVATRFAESIGRMVLLTGTPIMSRPRDLWRLLHMVDRWEWPDFGEYQKRYCRAPDEDQVQGRNVVTAHGRLEYIDELRARVEPVMLRRLKSEVLTDLPPKSHRTVSVQLDPADMADYRRAEKDVVNWIRQQEMGDVKARSAARAQAAVKLTMLRRLAAEYKMRRNGPVHDYLVQWFDRAQVAPLVVFAFHREVIARLYEECQILCHGRVSIIGSADDMNRRQRAIDAFSSGQTDVFIAPIKCGGVGVDGLQRRAADALFVERLWEPSSMKQAEDRVHRIGQLTPTTFTTIDAAGTIDDYIAKMNESKTVLISHALGDNDERIQGAVGLYDMYAKSA